MATTGDRIATLSELHEILGEIRGLKAQVGIALDALRKAAEELEPLTSHGVVYRITVDLDPVWKDPRDVCRALEHRFGENAYSINVDLVGPEPEEGVVSAMYVSDDI